MENNWGLVVFAGVLLAGAWYITRLMGEHHKRGDRGSEGSTSGLDA